MKQQKKKEKKREEGSHTRTNILLLFSCRRLSLAVRSTNNDDYGYKVMRDEAN